MSRFIDIIRGRDAEGHPAPALLREHRLIATMGIDHIDRETYDAICLAADRLGLSPQEVATIEWSMLPEFHPVSGRDQAFDVAMANGYKDVFIDFGDRLVLWLPASENWFMILAEPGAPAELAEARPNTGRADWDAWIEEPHHSTRGRQFLVDLRRKYGL